MSRFRSDLHRRFSIVLVILILSSLFAFAAFSIFPVEATTYFIDNFENFPASPTWTTVNVDGGTFTKSDAISHSGSYSGMCSSVGTISQAYAFTDDVVSCGFHHYQIWIYVDSSTTRDSGVLIAEMYSVAEGEFAEILGIRYHDGTYYLSNERPSGWDDVSTLAPNAWHKVDCFYYQAGKAHYYVDNVKKAEDWLTWQNPTSALTRNYLGDPSTSEPFAGNGFIYYDDLVIDDNMNEYELRSGSGLPNVGELFFWLPLLALAFFTGGVCGYYYSRHFYGKRKPEPPSSSS